LLQHKTRTTGTSKDVADEEKQTKMVEHVHRHFYCKRKPLKARQAHHTHGSTKLAEDHITAT
jgi:hypothetical protein